MKRGHWCAIRSVAGALGFLVSGTIAGCSASGDVPGKSDAPGATGSVGDEHGSGAASGTAEAASERTLVIEGEHLSALHVLALEPTAATTWQKIKFELVGGAEFAGGETTLMRDFGDGAVVLPQLRLTTGREAAVIVSIDGVENQNVRLIRIPEGSMGELEQWGEAEESISLGEHDALLEKAVVSKVLGDCQTFDAEMSRAAPGVERSTQALSFPRFCIRTPFGPGKVIWNNRSGFQVLPEGGSGSRPLQPATGSSQSVDAIWHPNFGCSFLKIPDHCTATVSSPSDISCCCNAAASVFQGRCRFTGPGEVGGKPAPGCR
jgi:hypothetical protein